MKRIFRTILVNLSLIFSAIVFVSSQSHALLPLNLTGNVDISYGESDGAGNDQETFQQKYSVNWSKHFLSNVSIQSAYNYNKTNLTQTSLDPFWLEKHTPFADIAWNNSNFILGSTYNYNRTNADETVLQLSRKSWSTYFKTKSIKYPLLSLRYSRDHTYNHVDLENQNLFEDRYQTDVRYSINQSVIHYAFIRRHNENKIRELSTLQNSHIVRLSNLKTFNDNKLRVSTNYSFTYSEQEDTRPSNTFDYFELTLFAGLYAQTNNFTLDSLSRVASLNDGNNDDAVTPLIDLGGIEVNQNIGVDFGYEQKVSALYLYIDQYTDKRMMHIYTSEDNLVWELYTSIPQITFNSAYSRLEILFPEVETRYIKVVNLDVSDIEHAYVTEIEALEGRPIPKTSTAISSSHLFDMLSRYTFSKQVSSIFDFSYQHLPGQFGSITRDNISYAFTTKYSQSSVISHNVRVQSNLQRFHGKGNDVTSYGLNYLFTYKPIQKLEFTLSSSMQLDYIDEMKNADNKSIVFGSKGTPIRNLNIAFISSFAKNKQSIAERVFDTWTHRINLDGAVTKSFSITGNYIHRTTNFTPENNYEEEYKVNSDQYLAGFRYRVSRTIMVRASYSLNRNITYYDSQSYMLSWNPSSKLSLNGQIRIQNNDNRIKTNRYNTQINYAISRNANIYFSYLVNDISKENDEKNQSIRIGFRSGI